jgi:hypothetical protein
MTSQECVYIACYVRDDPVNYGGAAVICLTATPKRANPGSSGR